MAEPPEQRRAQDEFLAEAQELIDSLSRDLLYLDERQKKGSASPDILNDLFRGVHTLKGLAGMFGYEVLGRVAHVLEDLLEDLRLGRVEPNQGVLDVLFEGVEQFSRLLADAQAGRAPSVNADQFTALVQSIGKVAPTAENVLEEFEIAEATLSVLTEYEEHRLRDNLERGLSVYRLWVQLTLDSIDTSLEQIKTSCREFAEIITYLPSMDSAGGDTIDIEILLATEADEEAIRGAIGRPDMRVSVIERKAGAAPVRSKSARATEHARSMSAPARPSPAGGKSRERAVEESAPSLRSLSSVVRVDIRKLDNLMNVVGELAGLRSTFAKLVEQLRATNSDRRITDNVDRVQRAFARYLSEVQEGVLDIRMVPLSQLFDKMAVVVRQVARDQGKQVRLHVVGEDTEVDKLIAEELADPLMHIVRNAIDHGVELPHERKESGKEEHALVAINAFQKGNHVVIEVQDDGAGIDLSSLRDAAIRKGLFSERALDELTRSELLQIVFVPGFSTAREVTDLSGRGVGMDVVKTNIQRLGGAVELSSVRGEGTTVTITLPITLAIINALLFEVAGHFMAIPLASVQEALRLERRAVRTVEGQEVLSLRGETLALCRLAHLFKLGSGSDEGFVIVVVTGQRRVGLVVDQLSGQQDVVIKGLGRSLAKVSGISGATDLGDGQLVLVVDTASIVEEVLSSRSSHLLAGELQ